MIENCLPKMTIEKKKNLLQHKGKHKNSKETYADWSKSIGKKVAFAVVFKNITRIGNLPKETSIHTVEMMEIKIALKEIHPQKMGNIY